MGKDASWKEYFSDPSRFADAINGFGCGGRQMVSSQDLQEVDTQINNSKYRDMVRKVAFGVNYVIIGLENQETIDYSLPLRNMIYDVAEYEKQVTTIRKSVRENAKGLTDGEYLYGFRKDSKLLPVTTFILYSGAEKWQGPTCLHDILDFTGIPETLREMIPNYKINIISTREPRDTSLFKTDLKYVLDFMQCAEDKKKVKQLTESIPYYQNMEEDAYDVVTSYADVKKLVEVKKYYTKEGKVDMCKGLRDWMLEEKEEGKAEGRAEGKAEGKAEGIIKTARKFQASDEVIISHLMEEMSIDEAQAREYLLQVS